jgi:hypothetical protein
MSEERSQPRKRDQFLKLGLRPKKWRKTGAPSIDSPSPTLSPLSQPQDRDSANTSCSLPVPNLDDPNLTTAATPAPNPTEKGQNVTAKATQNPTPPGQSLKAASTSTSSNKAPLWSEALSRFMKDHNDEYQILETILSSGAVQRFNSLVDIPTPKELQKDQDKVQHEFILRMKRYLPSLNAVKLVLTTFARLDPHEVAPYIVAGSFFVIEVSLSLCQSEQELATFKGDNHDITKL